jgi:AcrR family transcriptional regulator
VSDGLRERKKRVMRQQLSDTATRMFLERGFDRVRVAEVADVCGVSEKTVFNYFPVKEALIMDRLEGTLAALRTGLGDREQGPVEAVLAILARELGGMTGLLAGPRDAGAGRDAGVKGAGSRDAGGGRDAGAEDAGSRDAGPRDAGAGRGAAAEEAVRRQAVRRFGDLIRATPALRAYQADMMERSISVATGILAARAGLTPDDPEPQIAARALLGLWRVQADSLRKHLDHAATPARLHELVTADVRRAARIVEAGLQVLPAAD